MLSQILYFLILILVGVFAGFYYVKIIKRAVFGNLIGAIIVGIIGSVLGGFFLDPIMVFLISKNFFSVDFVACLVGAFSIIWVFSKVAHQ